MKQQPLLSTGSTLLNLACSDRASGGYPTGSYVFLVGDSASGKSFLSLTCFAEAAKSKHFCNHRLIFNDVEGGALMDFEKFFGKKMTEKIEHANSQTVEEFYFHLDDAIKQGKPFVYVLDSMDALLTEEEEDKFQERKEASAKHKKVSGSYGTSKAKMNSAYMRQAIQGLKKTGSILIVISQTRENIGWGSQFNPKTRSGGHALRFYSTCEIWSSIKNKLKKHVRGKDRELGINAKIEIKKNRMTGKLRTIELPILHDAGIDDLGSCIHWLVEEGFWKEEKNKINAKQFDFIGTSEALIRKIEEENREKELRAIVGDAWEELEASFRIQRKSRYP